MGNWLIVLHPVFNSKMQKLFVIKCHNVRLKDFSWGHFKELNKRTNVAYSFMKCHDVMFKQFADVEFVSWPQPYSPKVPGHEKVNIWIPFSPHGLEDVVH